jgi:phospholipid/cholesterol/gamma-HCH transport system ATP-binding protein
MTAAQHNNEKENDVVVEVTHLEKSFNDNQVLTGVDLKLHKGESIVVLGKSGSGKSVLIKCIIGLVKADSGEVRVFDKSIIGLEQRELDKIREKMGFVFQNSALYDSMTVRKNLEFPLRRKIREEGQSKIDRKVREALHSVGLEKTIDLMPSELSGGMTKRIGLARCLMIQPEIMLYDEPTTGLDPITGDEICNLMVDMQKKYNSSSVIITHDMRCAKLTASRLLVLIDGKIYAQGTYEELARSKDKHIKPFFV